MRYLFFQQSEKWKNVLHLYFVAQLGLSLSLSLFLSFAMLEGMSFDETNFLFVDLNPSKKVLVEMEILCGSDCWWNWIHPSRRRKHHVAIYQNPWNIFSSYTVIQGVILSSSTWGL